MPGKYFEFPWVRKHISTFSNGLAAKHWNNGDLAASQGHLHLLSNFSNSLTLTDEAMNCAAGVGNLFIVIWLHENRQEGCTVSAMDRASWHGHLEVVEWLHSHRNEGGTEAAMDLAARNGHLHVVEWLHHTRAEGCTPAFVQMAAEGGNADLLQWYARHIAGVGNLLEDERIVKSICEGWAAGAACFDFFAEMGWDPSLCYRYLPPESFASLTAQAVALLEASCSSSLGDFNKILEFLEGFTKTKRFTPFIIIRNIRLGAKGNIVILQWLSKFFKESFWIALGSFGGLYDDECCLDTLQWITNEGKLDCQKLLTKGQMNQLAREGKLRCLQWVYQNQEINARCTRRAFSEAVSTGHLRTAEWLLSREDHAEDIHEFLQKDVYLVDVGIYTAANGKLEALKWLCNNFAFPLDFSRCLVPAIRGGHLGMVEWLFSHGSPAELEDPFFSATEYNEDSNSCFQMVEWLFANVCQTISAASVTGAAENGHLTVMKWLHEKGGQYSKQAYVGAAQYGHLTLLKELYEPEWNDVEALHGPSMMGFVTVVQWMLERAKEDTSSTLCFNCFVDLCSNVQIVGTMIQECLQKHLEQMKMQSYHCICIGKNNDSQT